MSSVALYIHPSTPLLDRPARCQTSASHELAMDLIWRGGDERGGGWTEWVQPTCQAHWAVTVYHHCCLFQPWPLTPPLPTPRSTSLQAGPACRRSRRPSESQPVVEAMMPADLLLNRPCPSAGSYCQVHDQTSVEAFLLLLNIHNPHHHHQQRPYIVI